MMQGVDYNLLHISYKRGPKVRGKKMRQRKHRITSVLSSAIWEPSGLDAGPLTFAEVICCDGEGKVVT